MSREYTISEDGLSAGAVLGLTPMAMLEYARRAAPFSHELWNWRFREYVLYVDENGMIRDIELFDDRDREEQGGSVVAV